MRKTLRFMGVTVGAGLVLGGGLVALVIAQKPRAEPVAVKPGNVSLDSSAATKGQVTPGLSVTSDGGQGLPGSGSSASSSDGSTGGGGDTSGGAGDGSSGGSGNQLPTPSQFGTYDQYKNNPTALYIDVTPGTGKAVGQGSTVTMQYRGWLTNGQEFDETYARGKPYTFKMGDGTVIPGVAEAIFGMKEGGTRRLVIPPAVGYGAAGHNPIPPDAVMVFDVQLVSVSQ